MHMRTHSEPRTMVPVLFGISAELETSRKLWKFSEVNTVFPNLQSRKGGPSVLTSKSVAVFLHGLPLWF